MGEVDVAVVAGLLRTRTEAGKVAVRLRGSVVAGAVLRAASVGRAPAN